MLNQHLVEKEDACGGLSDGHVVHSFLLIRRTKEKGYSRLGLCRCIHGSRKADVCLGYRGKGFGWEGSQKTTLWDTYYVPAAVLVSFTDWACKGGRGTECSANAFWFFHSDDVTQVTQETFTEDPSKLLVCLFLCFHLGDRRVRMMSVQRKMRTRREVSGDSELTQSPVVCLRCLWHCKHAQSFYLFHFLLWRSLIFVQEPTCFHFSLSCLLLDHHPFIQPLFSFSFRKSISYLRFSFSVFLSLQIWWMILQQMKQVDFTTVL